MNTQLWVDLEGTIIPQWPELSTFINMDKLEAVIKEYQPTTMGVYSYIITDYEAHTEFQKSPVREHLSKLMDNSYIYTFMTGEMALHWLAQHKHKYLQPDNTIIWKQPKEFAFLMTVNHLIETGSKIERFILFDDTAPHNKRYNINDTVEVLFLNPDNM